MTGAPVRRFCRLDRAVARSDRARLIEGKVIEVDAFRYLGSVCPSQVAAGTPSLPAVIPGRSPVSDEILEIFWTGRKVKG